MVRQERQEKGGKGREVSRCGSVFRLAAPGGVAQESRAATDGASRMDTSPVNESLPCQEPWRGNVIRPRQVTWRGQIGYFWKYNCNRVNFKITIKKSPYLTIGVQRARSPTAGKGLQEMSGIGIASRAYSQGSSVAERKASVQMALGQSR